jgi:hypothetical protein
MHVMSFPSQPPDTKADVFGATALHMHFKSPIDPQHARLQPKPSLGTAYHSKAFCSVPHPWRNSIRPSRRMDVTALPGLEDR